MRTGSGPYPQVLPAGDEALLCAFDGGIDPQVNARVQAYAAAVRAAAIAGVVGVVPGYHSVLVSYDPRRLDGDELARILGDLGEAEPRPEPARHHDIPVCYGGDYGPDLGEVAAATGLTPDEVVALHAGELYRVYCLGFSPGFPYLASLPLRLRLPRRTAPRREVAQGSVAIAGLQTGIYPFQSSGGWHLIGRTPVRVFSWREPVSALTRPGDTVSFHPIDAGTFARLERELDPAGGASGG